MRLREAGGYQIDELPIAREYFNQYFPLLDSRTLLPQLFNHYQSGDVKAGLCLRCCISHYILQECRSLVRQFGDYYHFDESDLLPYVLDDVGSLEVEGYIPLACKILQSFNPNTSALGTWTVRLVRHHSELNRFLMEQGLYLVSDWAILNDTKPERLKQILINSYQWTPAAAAQAALILESYRVVYLPDRIAQGAKGKCAAPTPEQLQRMAAYLQSKCLSQNWVEQASCLPHRQARSLSHKSKNSFEIVSKFNESVVPETLLNELQKIAKFLRQNRLERYRPTTNSTDIPEIAHKAEQSLMTFEHSDTVTDAQKFLRRYRPQFRDCLDAALQQVVCDRVATFRTETKAEQFLTALQLFHCQCLSMTEIATRLALRGQYAVTHLLRLKQFRADVRLHMLAYLKTHVLETAKAYTAPERLRQFDQQIEIALNEQIESLLEVEAKQSRTAKKSIKISLFSKQLCAYLDRR